MTNCKLKAVSIIEDADIAAAARADLAEWCCNNACLNGYTAEQIGTLAVLLAGERVAHRDCFGRGQSAETPTADDKVDPRQLSILP